MASSEEDSVPFADRRGRYPDQKGDDAAEQSQYSSLLAAHKELIEKCNLQMQLINSQQQNQQYYLVTNSEELNPLLNSTQVINDTTMPSTSDNTSVNSVTNHTVSPITPTKPPPPPPPPSDIIEKDNPNKNCSPAELVKKIVVDQSYTDRLRMVSEILDLELECEEVVNRGIASTITSTIRSSPSKTFFPAQETFLAQFDDYVNELAARPGSHRHQNTVHNTPMGINDFPTRPKPKIEQYYKLPNYSWNPAATDAQEEARDNLIYDGKHFPRIEIANSRLKDWESIGRENLNMLSYLDRFLCASKELFSTLFHHIENLESEEELDKELLWNIGHQGICMTFSAGWTIDDLVRNSVWLSAESMLIRRDAILDRMKKKVPENHIKRMRYGNLNSSRLFVDRDLEDAKAAASREKDSRYQSEVIKHVSESTSSTKRKDTFDKPVHKKGKPEVQTPKTESFQGKFKPSSFANYKIPKKDSRSGKKGRTSNKPT